MKKKTPEQLRSHRWYGAKDMRSYPADGAVLMGGCDQTMPALLMGAISMNLPAIYMPAGPTSRFVWLAGVTAMILVGPPTLQGFSGLLIATVLLGVPLIFIRRTLFHRHANTRCREMLRQQ